MGFRDDAPGFRVKGSRFRVLRLGFKEGLVISCVWG